MNSPAVFSRDWIENTTASLVGRNDGHPGALSAAALNSNLGSENVALARSNAIDTSCEPSPAPVVASPAPEYKLNATRLPSGAKAGNPAFVTKEASPVEGTSAPVFMS
jgi:hypothetical protein